MLVKGATGGQVRLGAEASTDTVMTNFKFSMCMESAHEWLNVF